MLHLTKQELNQEISDLEGMKNAYKSQIRVTRTNMSNDKFVQESIADLKGKIEIFQKRIADLEYSVANGEQIITDAQVKVQSLDKRIKLLRHRRDIERLLELQKTINEMTEDAEDEDSSSSEHELETDNDGHLVEHDPVLLDEEDEDAEE